MIADRIDLTLECIRRHYGDAEGLNPLGDRLAYYGDFFELFGDFETYVRFFLLDDLVTPGFDAVRSLVDGEAITTFRNSGIAADVAEYVAFRTRSIEFVRARNERIQGLGL